MRYLSPLAGFPAYGLAPIYTLLTPSSSSIGYRALWSGAGKAPRPTPFEFSAWAPMGPQLVSARSVVEQRRAYKFRMTRSRRSGMETGRTEEGRPVLPKLTVFVNVDG